MLEEEKRIEEGVILNTVIGVFLVGMPMKEVLCAINYPGYIVVRPDMAAKLSHTGRMIQATPGTQPQPEVVLSGIAEDEIFIALGASVLTPMGKPELEGLHKVLYPSNIEVVPEGVDPHRIIDIGQHFRKGADES